MGSGHPRFPMFYVANKLAFRGPETSARSLPALSPESSGVSRRAGRQAGGGTPGRGFGPKFRCLCCRPVRRGRHVVPEDGQPRPQLLSAALSPTPTSRPPAPLPAWQLVASAAPDQALTQVASARLPPLQLTPGAGVGGRSWSVCSDESETAAPRPGRGQQGAGGRPTCPNQGCCCSALGVPDPRPGWGRKHGPPSGSGPTGRLCHPFRGLCWPSSRTG